MSNERLDLIDRHALLENADVFTMHTKEYGSIEVIPVDAVGDAPTVDAVPVVHGRWIWSEENECWVCSNCEMSALNDYRGNSTASDYCPKCGAKMDGGNYENP